MAISVMQRVLHSTIAPASTKLVALVLASHCDEGGGNCFPSLQSIADESSISRDQARRVVNGLVAAGLVSVTGRTGGAHAPRYQLNLGAIDALRRPKRNSSAQGEGPSATGGADATPTPSTDATPTGGVGATPARSADVPTGGVGATEGVAYRPATGGADATRTVKNRHLTQKERAASAVVKEDRPRQSRAAMTFASWLASLPQGEKAVPDLDPIFAYADRTGIPREYLHLAWLEFKARHSNPGGKKYSDWRATFRNAVRGNWLKLWRADGDTYVLTTVGVQARRFHQEQAA